MSILSQREPGTIAGFRIVVQAHWPVIEDEPVVHHFPHHPAITWLFGVLNRLGARLPMTISVTERRWREADYVLDTARSVIFCSPSQYDRLKRAFFAVSAQDASRR